MITNLKWKPLNYLPWQPNEFEPLNEKDDPVDENRLDGWKVSHVAEVLDDLVSLFSE